MSRIRSIHPGLWTDEAFMALSAPARLLLIGLWTEAYDDGVFEWKPLTLRARIFPVDTVEMAGLFDELIAGGFVRREAVLGRPIGLIRNFRAFQRPKKPNSSGLLRPEWEAYVGLGPANAEAIPHPAATIPELFAQMEEEGGEKEESTPPPPVPEAAAREIFATLWSVFPRNPTSSRTRAEAAFTALSPAERQPVLAAARRYQRWFAEDCAARGRSREAGRRYAPHLSKWLGDGAWREAAGLALAVDPERPVVTMVRLDRILDATLWAACETVRGKPAPASPWSFEPEVVAAARALVAEAVH
jgi:hypothetical protein